MHPTALLRGNSGSSCHGDWPIAQLLLLELSGVQSCCSSNDRRCHVGGTCHCGAIVITLQPSVAHSRSAGSHSFGHASLHAGTLEELQCKGALSSLLAATSDGEMMGLSMLRDSSAPLCLEASRSGSSLTLMRAWESCPASPQLLGQLLQAIDAGVISILSRALFAKMGWESQGKPACASLLSRPSQRFWHCVK